MAHSIKISDYIVQNGGEIRIDQRAPEMVFAPRKQQFDIIGDAICGRTDLHKSTPDTTVWSVDLTPLFSQGGTLTINRGIGAEHIRIDAFNGGWAVRLHGSDRVVGYKPAFYRSIHEGFLSVNRYNVLDIVGATFVVG